MTANPLDPHAQLRPCAGESRSRAKHLASATALLMVVPAAHLLAPLILQDRIPFCAFRCATGKPCPFCGLTRAVAEAAHFHWRAAFGFNPLWPLAVGAILLFAALHAVDAWKNSTHASLFARAVMSRWIGILVSLLVFDVWRIIAMSP